MKQDILNILRQVSKDSNISQRNMAKKLNMSIGKLNYCLKELQKKGLVKIKNFKTHPNKIGYAYLLTPKGILEKTKITINFMKRKMEEYEELREELEKSKKNQKKN
jgi:EPS-associated MarR family transcriptional regulator